MIFNYFGVNKQDNFFYYLYITFVPVLFGMVVQFLFFYSKRCLKYKLKFNIKPILIQVLPAALFAVPMAITNINFIPIVSNFIYQIQYHNPMLQTLSAVWLGNAIIYSILSDCKKNH